MLMAFDRCEASMTGFVQIIEFKSSRSDEIRALAEEVRDQPGSLAVRGTITADRDRPDTYLNIGEFESVESAMENSQRRRPKSLRPRWPSCVTDRRSSITST